MGTKVADQDRDERALALRDSRAVAFFGTWMLTGLFIDGWAHATDKPETFFSPWHGILYSGFVAAVLWFAWDGRRQPGGMDTGDRLGTAGLFLFVVGAVGDGVWHEVFGIEVGIEALLSPTHLALMVGGLLMVTAPIRAGWRWLPERPSGREFAATMGAVTLATSLVLFFLMYLSAAMPIAESHSGSYGGESGQVWGVASVIVRTAVLLGATLFVLRRFTPPAGSFTALFSVTAVALAGLESFEPIALAVPFVAGGTVADVIVARGLGGARRDLLIGMAVPAVCWLGYFGVHAAVWGVRWPAEIWTGSVVFAVLTGLGLALLTNGLEPGRLVERDGARPEVGDVEARRAEHEVERSSAEHEVLRG